MPASEDGRASADSSADRLRTGHASGHHLRGGDPDSQVVLLGPDVREQHVAIHLLTMRPLGAAEIAEYVALDRPEACAGSYKFESRGAALMATVLGGDRTAIQGLPLRALSAMLHRSLGAARGASVPRIRRAENVRSR